MKTDSYTKAVLTVIAAALVVIAYNQFTHLTPVHAQASSLQFAIRDGPVQPHFDLFDPNSKIVSIYDSDGSFITTVKLGR